MSKRQDFTLEELLDDEDVLQECRNQNNKLVTFLSQEESVKKLLAYVTNEPEGSPDDRLRFKYPNVASELLTTDSPGILDVICTTESLDLIWGVLDQPAPLNPLIARYVRPKRQLARLVCCVAPVGAGCCSERMAALATAGRSAA